jgi:pyruvate dehydrogenase E2 component (dihydrolipoamide acetyltransferase)
MGYDMIEGTVVRWIKAEGDEVKRGDPVAEIETDKAVVEMESTANGLLRKILVNEGETVPVGHLIGVIGNADEDITAVSSDTPGSTTGAEVTADPAEKETTASASKATETKAEGKSTSERVKASPVAKKLADEKGIDLASVTGTGPAGRITREDIVNFKKFDEVAEPPSGEPDEGRATGGKVQLSRMRQGIARATSQSKNGTPHFYITIAIDMTQSMTLRGQINQQLEGAERVSVNDMVMKAAVMGLIKHSGLNASYQGEHLETYAHVNLGMAIATDEGLMVPAIVNAQDKSLSELAVASKDLAQRAGEGRLRQEEYTGTFSTSNLGMFGVDAFSAIILPPQAATLAISAVKKQAIVDEGDKIVIRQMMNVTLSIDHRVSDGVESSQFLAEVKRILENPGLLLLK